MIKNSTKPNVILIGAQKCGTTSLFDWISQHPDVHGHKGMKDYNFFAKDELYNGLGVKWFEKQFKNCNSKVVLHGSVSYVFFKKAADRIYDFNEDIKLILVLRNPVQRAISSFNDLRKIGKDQGKTINEIFEYNLELVKAGKNQEEVHFMDSILTQGLYSEQIENFSKFSKKGNLKIILFDDLVKSPHIVMKDIFDYINVDNFFEPILEKKNVQGAPKSIMLQNFFQNLKAPKFLKKYLPVASLSQFKTYLIRTFNTTDLEVKSALDPQDLNYLKDFYSEEITRLESLLKLNLDRWR